MMTLAEVETLHGVDRARLLAQLQLEQIPAADRELSPLLRYLVQTRHAARAS